MKKLFIILITAAMFAACNSRPPDDDLQKTIDSLMVTKRVVAKGPGDTTIMIGLIDEGDGKTSAIEIKQ